MTDRELQLKAVALRRAMLRLIVNAGRNSGGGVWKLFQLGSVSSRLTIF
jgi:hypothetical protein